MAGQHDAEFPNPEIARLIKKKAQKLGKCPEYRHEELDDIIQELHLKLLEILARHDPQRGSMITYADIALNNHIRNMIASRRAQKRDDRMCTRSLDDTVISAEEKGMTRHEIYAQDDYFRMTGKRSRRQSELDELRIDIQRVLARLPPRQRELALRLMEQTVSEAARSMEISRTTLYGWLKHIRAVFAELDLDDYL